MSSPVSFLAVVHCLRTLSLVAVDLIRLVALAARPRAALAAENLFLRKQLACLWSAKIRPSPQGVRPRAFVAQGKNWRTHSLNDHAQQEVALAQKPEPPDEALPLVLLEHGIECPVELPRGDVSGLIDLPQSWNVQRIGQHDGPLRISHVTSS